MALYSVKKSRGRKIKKYRKSRRGKERGKINLKCGKTRRYKVFKNTKNHTLGKRKGRGRGRGRQMIGGSIKWIENDESYNNLMKDYINAKYKDKIIEYLGIKGTTITGFSKVQQMCNKVVMITNKSKGMFLREENQLQRLLIYSCHMNGGQGVMVGGGGQPDTIVCYALVRVPHLLYKNKGNGPPIVGMNDKILFIRQDLSSVTNINMNIGVTKQEQSEILESFKKTLIQSSTKKTNEILKVLQKEKIDKADRKANEQVLKDALEIKIKEYKSMSYQYFCNLFRCYEFKSFISSSGDKYRIFMSVDPAMQCSLFDTLSKTQAQPPETPQEQHEEPQEKSPEQHEEPQERHHEEQSIDPDEAMTHEDQQEDQQVDAS